MPNNNSRFNIQLLQELCEPVCRLLLCEGRFDTITSSTSRQFQAYDSVGLGQSIERRPVGPCSDNLAGEDQDNDVACASCRVVCSVFTNFDEVGVQLPAERSPRGGADRDALSRAVLTNCMYGRSIQAPRCFAARREVWTPWGFWEHTAVLVCENGLAICRALMQSLQRLQ